MDPAGVAPALVTDMGRPKSEEPAPLTSWKTTAASKTMLNADVARPNIAAQPLSFSSVVFNETTLRGRQLLEKGKKSWLKTGEVLELLENYEKYLLRVSSFAPFLPKGGDMFLVNKAHVRNFRKDSHVWRKKKDGKNIAETHEKLKVGPKDMLNCYYAQSEKNYKFQRRIYWQLEKKTGSVDLVLMHYLGSLDDPEGLEKSAKMNSAQSSQRGAGAASALSDGLRDAREGHSTGSNGGMLGAGEGGVGAEYRITRDPPTVPEKTPPIDIKGMPGPAGKELEQAYGHQQLQVTTTRSGADAFMDSFSNGVGPLEFDVSESMLLETLHTFSHSDAEALGWTVSGRSMSLDRGNELASSYPNHEASLLLSCSPSTMHPDSSDTKRRPKSLGSEFELLGAGLHQRVTFDAETGGDGPVGQFGVDFGGMVQQDMGPMMLGRCVEAVVPKGRRNSGARGRRRNPLASKGRKSNAGSPVVGVPATSPENGDNARVGKEVGGEGLLELNEASKGGQPADFSINEIAPEWDFCAGGAKVLLTWTLEERHRASLMDAPLYVKFGRIRVPATVVQDGVVKCFAPSHNQQSAVQIQIVSEDESICSDVLQFWYRNLGRPGSGGDSDVQKKRLLLKPVSIHTEREFLLNLLESLLAPALTLLPADFATSEGLERKRLNIIRCLPMQLPASVTMANHTGKQELKRFIQQLRDEELRFVTSRILQNNFNDYITLDAASSRKAKRKHLSSLRCGLGLIHTIAALGYSDQIPVFATAGVDIDLRGSDGRTALHWAALRGHYRTVVALVGAGAEPNAMSGPAPGGLSPSELAEAAGHDEIVTYLAETVLARSLSNMNIQAARLRPDGARCAERAPATEDPGQPNAGEGSPGSLDADVGDTSGATVPARSTATEETIRARDNAPVKVTATHKRSRAVSEEGEGPTPRNGSSALPHSVGEDDGDADESLQAQEAVRVIQRKFRRYSSRRHNAAATIQRQFHAYLRKKSASSQSLLDCGETFDQHAAPADVGVAMQHGGRSGDAINNGPRFIGDDDGISDDGHKPSRRRRVLV